MFFWAKTTKEGKPGTSVVEHMTDVGEVARQLAQDIPLELFPLTLGPNALGALAALHDIGKIAPGFQRKCPAWLEENKLTKIDKNDDWDSLRKDHGLFSQKQVQEFLEAQGVPSSSADLLASALGAHHGKIRCNPFGTVPKIHDEEISGILWQQERDAACKKIFDYFKPVLSKLNIGKTDPGLWWLAGLTSVADWIGSDERFFPTDQSKEEEKQKAKTALEAIGWRPPHIRSALSFEEIFGFPPNDLQKKTHSTIDQRGLYVIEAPMGLGKTEAALCAAYRLLSKGQASGIYFALPTQATSNRIHIRLEAFVRAIADGEQSSKLIHGTSWLSEKENAATRNKEGRDWFSSPKRALLAPFGVGTIDQALLGVVAAKHFFVRRFALAGKVVILDEIHSYDAYTSRLIEALIAELLQLKCTIIVLSATLTEAMRARLMNDKQGDNPPHAEFDPFPLISYQKDRAIGNIKTEAPPTRKVSTLFQTNAQAMEHAISSANKGACVVWITDTVDSAQKTYEALCQKADGRFKMGLLHSRFPLWRRTQIEEEWMTRLDKTGDHREPCILVSTQIIEQSVDIDADLIVSELAPIDMLLQRMGRLWRHKRDARPLQEPTFVVIEEKQPWEMLMQGSAEKIKATLGNKAYVYEPYILLRTLESLQPFKKGAPLRLPDDIRSLLDSVYTAPNEQTSGMDTLEVEMDGHIGALRQFALGNTNIWKIALNDVEGVQTRLNDRPTTSLILCRGRTKESITFLDGQCLPIPDAKTYDLPFKRALYKNLVRISADKVPGTDDERLKRYLFGSFCLGIVQDNGTVQCTATLSWSPDIGIRLIKSNEDNT